MAGGFDLAAHYEEANRVHWNLRQSLKGTVGGVRFDLTHEMLNQDWNCPDVVGAGAFHIESGHVDMLQSMLSVFGSAAEPPPFDPNVHNRSPNKVYPGDLVRIVTVEVDVVAKKLGSPLDRDVLLVTTEILRSTGEIDPGLTLEFTRCGSTLEGMDEHHAFETLLARMNVMLEDIPGDEDPDPNSLEGRAGLLCLAVANGREMFEDNLAIICPGEGPLSAESIMGAAMKKLVNQAVRFGYAIKELESERYLRDGAERAQADLLQRQLAAKAAGDRTRNPRWVAAGEKFFETNPLATLHAAVKAAKGPDDDQVSVRRALESIVPASSPSFKTAQMAIERRKEKKREAKARKRAQ